MAVDAGAAFARLAEEMSRVTDVLSTQSISQVIETFEGNPKSFRSWVASIDKYCNLSNLPATRKKTIALRASAGPVSGFIQRYTAAIPDGTWDALRRELAKRFSDVTDPQFALSVLRNIRQNQGENIQVFAERILSLAEEAFQGVNGDAVERQLIDTFVDGLTSDQSKLRILRSRPKTLQEAIDTVTTEENLLARVALSSSPRNHKHDTQYRHDPHSNTFHRNTKHETQTFSGNARQNNRETPMEVDHYRPKPFRPKCFKCKKIGHFSKDCRSISAVNDRGTFDRRWERNKNKCWRCGQEGHIMRDCGNDRLTDRPDVRQRFGGDQRNGNQGN